MTPSPGNANNSSMEAVVAIKIDIETGKNVSSDVDTCRAMIQPKHEMPVHKDWMLVGVKVDSTVGTMKWPPDLVSNSSTQAVVAIAIDSPARSNVRIFVSNDTASFNLISEWLVLHNLVVEHHLLSVTKRRIRDRVTNS